MATSILSNRILLCAIFSLCGFLGNWFKVSLFFNVDFIFGSAFSMLAILVLGGTYGVISAFIAASCTYLLWNHPWAIIIFTGEAVVVSWLYNKRQDSLVVYDLIYWICLGMPSVYLFYHLVMGFAVQATLLVMLKQVINGLTNALLATLALLLHKFVKKTYGFKASYAELVSVAMIAFALFPTLLLSMSAIRKYEETDMERLQARVASSTQIAHKNLSGWVNDYHGHVQVLAKFIGDPNVRPVKEMQRYVEIIRETNPAIKGMGVFDNRSISVSYSPLEQDGKSNLGIDMSFRPHIASLREDKKPYITDMLISKLGTPSPIVILLAPIVISGEYKGYCSGVVETSNLAGFLTNLKTQDIHITLVDGQNKVIVSTSPNTQTNAPFSRPYLQPGQETSGYQPILWQPETKPNTSPMQQWRHSFLFSSVPVSEHCRWRLIVEAPLLPIAEDISRYSLNWLGLQALLISVAVVFSSLLSHGFIANVRKLQLLTRSVQERLDDPSRIEWPDSAIEELAELSSNFRQMTSALVNHIAEQKSTESALRESEEHLKAMFEMAAVGVAQADPNTGRWVRVNQKMSEITGYSNDELLTMRISEITHPEDRDRDCEAFQSVVSNRAKDYRLEKRYIRKDGAIAWVNVNMTVIRDAAGQPIRTVAMIEDITERRRTEEALRESEARFKALHNASFDGIAIHDQGIILECNQGLVEISGYTEDELIGMDGLLLIAPSTRDLVMRNILSGYEKPYEAMGVRKNGEEYPLRLEARNIPYKGKPVRSVEFRDITEAKRAEAERQLLQDQLLHAQKMEAIGTLAGGIAHDFNNILSAILGYAEMAKEDSAPESAVSAKLDRVIEAGNRATGLVKQILAFSRQAASESVPLNPELIIKEAIKLLRPSLPSTITITQQLAPSVHTIVADPTQFHQLVMNLCTNAFHAMEQTGGTLSVSLGNQELTDQDIQQHPNVKPGKFVILSVSDTGTGVPPEIRGRIFEPYFTSKGVGKGTGMGLAIVHGIATALGGFVTCESALGRGTVFRAYFPATLSDVAPLPVSTDTIPTGKEHVLYVDDEETLAELGKTMLERLGYHVTLCTDSMVALCLIQEHPNEYDILVTDQTMPKMTGFDLARNALLIRPDLPIILCTGYSNLVDEVAAKKAGIKGFIMKPLTKKGLAELLAKVKNENNAQKQFAQI